MKNLIPSPHSRRYDLDWLRVAAFILLIFFHVGMFFNHWGWHVKNNELSHLIEYPMRYTSQWRMSLLFMISGAGVYFALGNRSSGSFMGERFVRIFIPLVFGMLVIVPPQIFFERLTQGQTYSYLEFYKTVFHFQPYPKGNLSWHHLWYLVYIFVYSLVGLPLLLFIRNRPQMTLKWAHFFNRPFMLIGIPVLWHVAGELWLGDQFPDTHNLTRDWNLHFHDFTLFVSGFVLCSNIAFWKTIARLRRLTFGISIALTLVLYTVFWFNDRNLGEWYVLLYEFIVTTNTWCILLAIFGYAYTYLQFTNPFLKYANEAVYPFYILHQTVIICLAYPLINMPWAISAKYTYLSATTFLLCLVLYHFIIRRFNLFRFLFGLKVRKKQSLRNQPEKSIFLES